MCVPGRRLSRVQKLLWWPDLGLRHKSGGIEMKKKTINFLLAGVGGQGTLLASDIVAEVGLAAGFDAKKSEVHGMAQRGGAVVSHVRWGEKVASPLCERGTVDYFVAQETLEALRWLEFLRPGGTVVLSEQQLPPTSTVYGKDVYPEEADALSAISELAGGVLLIDAVGIAEALGNRRAANSVLLGALSSKLEVSPEDWLAVLENKVPQRHKEVNRKAFNAGREGQWELKQVPG
jgi:indolepyruvate ferredoxin oxidoreductase beta subunit